MRSIFVSMYTFEITTADPLYFLKTLAIQGVCVYDVHQADEVHIQISVMKSQTDLVWKTADRMGSQIRILKLFGPVRWAAYIKRRNALICGVLLLLVLTMYIPTRILFVDVEGNEYLQSDYILDHAEKAGLHFGVLRKNIRSEKIKNALLESANELKWVGINTYGCRAVISVIERSTSEKESDLLHGSQAQGIYAVRDGVISSITATKGTLICKTGQAVCAGQLLISGYTDCGHVIRAESAEGEVRALTHRRIEAVVPSSNGSSVAASGKIIKWSIKFGKKRIKLYNDSGNLDTQCGRIIKEYKLGLPGSFYLPVSIIEETIVIYDNASETWKPDEDTFRDLATDYVLDSMVAGKVLSSNIAVEDDGNLYRLTGLYVCDELIGKLQDEGLEELDDRTNR